jgi:hypothetical protein
MHNPLDFVIPQMADSSILNHLFLPILPPSSRSGVGMLLPDGVGMNKEEVFDL